MSWLQKIIEWFKTGFKGVSTPELNAVVTPLESMAVTATVSSGKVLNGIDLSHWQPIKDLKKLAASLDPLISFGFTKLTEHTSFYDTEAKNIVSQLQSIACPVGVYHVIHCHKDIAAQVKWFKTCLAKISAPNLRHVIDFETEVNKGNSTALNKAKCLEMIRAFTKEFGFKPIFYCNSGDLNNFKFTEAEASEFDMWVANYGTEEKALKPVYGVKKYLMWQRSDKKAVPGVGNCDYNNLYGTLNDLMISPSKSAPSVVTPPTTEGVSQTSRDHAFMIVASSLGYVKQAQYQLDHWHKKHPNSNPRYRMLVDFGMKDTLKRAFLIDCDNSSVEVHRVSHGAGSDTNKDGYADTFSNKDGSHASMLGVYRVAETYTGKHGYSCRLDGEEESNKSARSRAVVIHAADYVSDAEKIVSTGDSWGCFAFDPKNSKAIIDKLKDGSPLYAFKD